MNGKGDALLLGERVQIRGRVVALILIESGTRLDQALPQRTVLERHLSVTTDVRDQHHPY